MSALEYKSIPFELREIKAADGDGWEIAGYASTFWGEPDAYGDIIAPGAFAQSIAERKTKFLYEHYEPIGAQIELYEDEHGLFGRWSVVDTRAGTDAYKLAKAGVLDALSIGFVPETVEYRDDVRVLTRITLYEVSAVAIPANDNARVTAVKSPPAARCSCADTEGPREARGGSVVRGPGRAETTTEPPLRIGRELRRRRLARHGITIGV